MKYLLFQSDDYGITNGVSDGIATYGKVVDLLLQYYDGVLY